MPLDFNDTLVQLINDYKQNPDKYIFFLGAGMSMPIFPSWQQLLMEIVNTAEINGKSKFEKDDLLGNINSGKYYLEIAETLIKNVLTTNEYREILEKNIDIEIDMNQISQSYKLIFKLKPKAIITTNYDRIPDVLSNGEYRIYSNNNTSEALRAINQGRKIVYKMHGDIQNHESIVFTEKDYDKAINNLGVKNLLEVMFSTYSVIFLGFGFSDPHINQILEFLSKIHNNIGLPHYTLLPEIGEFEKYQYENKYNVKCISYKPKDNSHPEIVDFVKLLAEEKFNQDINTIAKIEKKRFNEFSKNGFIKIVDSNEDRISDYKKCLLEASGECFITGTSMIHLAEDSGHILAEKIQQGYVKILILDPQWIEENSTILTFLNHEDDRKEFSYEIRNSIRKLKAIKRNLPQDLSERFIIKTYSTIFPYIITGYESDGYGKMVVEITDYIPESFRPRFTLHKSNDNNLYEIVKRKFYSLWNNPILTKEV